MRGEDEFGDEEYENVQDKLLDSFENELSASDKRTKKARMVILAGLSLGLITGGLVWLLAADPDATPELNSPEVTTTTATETVVIEPTKRTTTPPEPELRATEEQTVTEAAVTPEIAAAIATPDASPPPEQPLDIDQRIALLEQKNMIAEDMGPEHISADPAPTQIEQPVPTIKPPKQTQQKKPSSPVADTKAKANGRRYAVQALATTDADRAMRRRDKLRAEGLDAWISTGKVKKAVYRVETDRFKNVRAASDLSARLSEKGYANKVVKLLSSNRITLDLGTFHNQMAATDLAVKIIADGFAVSVESLKQPQTLYMVRIGHFVSITEANKTNDSIIASGRNTLGVVGVER